MRARGYSRGGVHRRRRLVRGPRRGSAGGTFFLVANGPEGASGANVERTESGFGDGFYEAVVQSLVQ